MTGAPRRRRHDPLPPVGSGRVVPPGPSTIDLHTHTTRSDGVMQPAALVGAAFDAGVRLMALTDHDNLAGYREVVAADAIPSGMTLIPGVEINAIVTRDLGLWEGELHVLGFGMDAADEAFEATLAAQRGRRRERFDRTVTLLRTLDLSIDDQVQDVSGSDDDSLGRPTVARALVSAGHAASVDDAFQRLLAWGKPGYVPRTGLGPTDANFNSFKKFKENKDTFLLEIIRKNIQRGIEEGLYRPDLDVEVLSRYRLESMMAPFNIDVFPPSKFNLAEVTLIIIEHFVFGLTTLKGHNLILQYQTML